MEAITTFEELTVPMLVRGPCLLNAVQGGKTPGLSMDDAQAMDYRLAILPSLLLSTAETVLAALKAIKWPPSASGKLDVAGRFRRFRSDDWDALRDRFREQTPAKAAQEAAE